MGRLFSAVGLTLVNLATLVAQQPSAYNPSKLPPRLTRIVNSYPAVASDGSRIVFQSNRTGVFQIYSIRADGSDVRQLTDMRDDSYGPSYSPNGKLITFAHGSRGKSDIYVMRSDGTDSHPITHDGLDNSHPHWAPNGRRIIFNSSRTTPAADRGDEHKEQDDVFSMALDGSDLRQHTHCGTVCTYAFFSPDMKMIVYRKVTATAGLNWDLSSAHRNSEIAVANSDGSEERILATSEAFDGWPTWSPDGKWIAFTSNRVGAAEHIPNNGQIFAMSPEGDKLRQISWLPGSYAQPSWSPDGRKIYAYAATEVGESEWGDIVVFDANLQSLFAL
jgi:TolB protein